MNRSTRFAYSSRTNFPRGMSPVIFVFSLYAVGMISGCTDAKEREKALLVGRKIAVGEEPQNKYPTSWVVKLISPKDNERFKSGKPIMCEFAIESRDEFMLPLSSTVTIHKNGTQYANSHPAKLLSRMDTTYRYGASVDCPAKIGSYLLDVNCIDVWWFEKSSGEMSKKPKVIGCRSKPVMIKVINAK